jgi:hypothetical protein
MSIFPLIAGEENDLALHTQICAERYQGLDKRLDSLENKVDKIGNKIDINRSDIIKSLIATAGTVIVAVVGAVAVFLSRMP